MVTGIASYVQPLLNKYLAYCSNEVSLAVASLCLERIGYICANEALEGNTQQVKESLNNPKDTRWRILMIAEALISIAKLGQMWALSRLRTLDQMDVIYPLGAFCAARVICMSQYHARTTRNKQEYQPDFQLAALVDITVRAFNILATGALLRHHSQAAMVAGVVVMTALSIENMRQHGNVLNRLEHILFQMPRTENIIDLFLGPSVREYFWRKKV